MVRRRSRATIFDLGQLLGLFGVLIGAASLFVGLRALAAGMADHRAGAKALAAGAEPSNTSLGAILVVVGVGLISLVVITSAGPWRKAEIKHLPIHLPDLHAPPAAIERGEPPSSAG